MIVFVLRFVSVIDRVLVGVFIIRWIIVLFWLQFGIVLGWVFVICRGILIWRRFLSEGRWSIWVWFLELLFCWIVDRWYFNGRNVRFWRFILFVLLLRWILCIRIWIRVFIVIGSILGILVVVRRLFRYGMIVIRRSIVYVVW